MGLPVVLRLEPPAGGSQVGTIGGQAVTLLLLFPWGCVVH
jgi:hypothetical protein